MNNLGKFALMGAILALASTPALAQGRGNGVGVGVGAGAGVSGQIGGQSGMNGNFGGDANVGAQGRLNGNGPNASDRDFGQDRAEDRPAVRSDNSANGGASAMGGLNADHASANARANASSNSRVGEIATYQSQMKAALAIQNPAQRNAAITSARQQLAQTTNKPLTSSAITNLDQQLNIQGASPTLGASQ